MSDSIVKVAIWKLCALCNMPTSSAHVMYPPTCNTAIRLVMAKSVLQAGKLLAQVTLIAC